MKDLDVLTCFDNNVVSFNDNKLDLRFKDDMDAAPLIARRLEAMRACKDAGLLTACFIAPMFPLITDCFEIIEAVRDNCDSIWIDGLNLQSGNLGKVTGYISAEYSWAFPLYRKIFKERDGSWWLEESSRLKEYARKQGLPYTNGQVKMARAPLGHPVLIDYLPRCAARLKR